MDQKGEDPGFEQLDSGDPATLLVHITAPNLTYKSAPDVSRRLKVVVQEALTPSQHYQTVILDLAGVRLLDSSGASLIIALHKTAEKADAALCLCSPAPHVLSILELLGMRSRIGIFPSRREALESARNR